ncbi:hypothetical protein [Bacillus sp. FJAT-45350]|uniref:hypothetical protein n=1 Tax=Bacillus sp. FJAT-45350 TaxID=2011014 RepID=UPI000BB959D9|nr:hypothetical protein [Bacillus sp. FJAT-45350]
MDQEKHRISVRLNGKERPYEEMEETREPHLDTEAFEDVFEPVERIKPFEPEEKKSNKIVDFGRKLTERNKAKVPFWDDGNREKSPKLPYKRKKKKSKSIKFSLKSLPVGLLVAAVSAIIVGVSFGFMVLTVFTGDSTATSGSVVANGTIELLSGQDSSTMPDLTFEVVQGGAFSTIDKGTETVNGIQQAGFAATLLENNEPYLLFIGIGQDREHANRLSQFYSQQGQETYIKPYAILGSKVNVENQQTIAYFHEGARLYQELMALSVVELANGNSTVTLETVQSYTASLLGMEEIQGESFSVLAEDEKQLATKFFQSLQQSVNHVSAYQQASDEIELWKIQQSLLQAMVVYEQLIEKLN